jgi:hypothetical protein
MQNRLLDNIFYGNELAHLHACCPTLKRNHVREIPDGERGDWKSLVEITRTFFRERGKGAFGGPITAGDALFIASYIARKRPAQIFEIGVASGFSSAFILYVAERLGLLADSIFLFSVDVADKTSKAGVIGQYVQRHHSHLTGYWSLSTQTTAIDVLNGRGKMPKAVNAPSLAFVDAEHGHPWPMLDAYVMSLLLPTGSWILMQDYQVTERWFADSIEFGIPVLAPQRGVNIAVALWPGEKVIGTKMAYNMAALRVPCKEEMAGFLSHFDEYQYEVDFSDNDKKNLPSSLTR